MVRTLIEPGKVREALAELPEGRVSNGSAFAICYENQHINRIKSVRYENNIPTGKGEYGSMDLPFFIFNTPFFRISI
ncbi:MAG: hypothetical protein GY801_50690 [bacterium]|nr:hypothetical protein [bacterium]